MVNNLTSIFRAGLKPIGLIAHNWAPRWSYLLLSVQVHTTTHCRIYTTRKGRGAAYPKAFHKIMMDIVH